MGRSPLFATVSVTVLRPLFSSISPSLISISPGIMAASPSPKADGQRCREAGNQNGEQQYVEPRQRARRMRMLMRRQRRMGDRGAGEHEERRSEENASHVDDLQRMGSWT